MTKRNKALLLIGLLCLGILLFLFMIRDILLPFVLAFVLAYFLHPSVVKLQRKKISPNIATSVVVGVFCLFVILILLILIPILQTQIFAFVVKIPAFAKTILESVREIIIYTKQNISPDQLTQISNAVSETAFGVFNSFGNTLLKLISGGVAVFNVVSLILITPVVLFYVLRDWKDVSEKLHRVVPKKQEKMVMGLMDEINQSLAGFIRGQASVCLFLGLYYGLSLSLLGLDLGILVGFLSGILSFIPYFGFLIGVLLSILIAFTQHVGWGIWIGLAVVFGLGQVLESYILTPRLVGERVGLSPAWVIFALLAGGALFGFLGILIAVPVAAVIGVLIRRVFKWYQSTPFYKGS